MASVGRHDGDAERLLQVHSFRFGDGLVSGHGVSYGLIPSMGVEATGSRGQSQQEVSGDP
jgi:hypothetical protein